MLRQANIEPLAGLRHRWRPTLMLATLVLAGVVAACTSGSTTQATPTSASTATRTDSSISSASVFTLPPQPLPSNSSTSSSPDPSSITAPSSRPSNKTPTSSATTAPTTPVDQRFTWIVGPTAPKTAAALSDIAAAEPVYTGFMATYDSSFRSPRERDWQPVMAKYASGQALSAWRAAWQSAVQYGTTQRGTMAAAARVEGAGHTSAGDSVSVRACMDFSRTNAVDAAGNQIPMASGQPTKNFAWLLTFQKVNGQMRVLEFVAKTGTGKTFSC